MPRGHPNLSPMPCGHSQNMIIWPVCPHIPGGPSQHTSVWPVCAHMPRGHSWPVIMPRAPPPPPHFYALWAFPTISHTLRSPQTALWAPQTCAHALWASRPCPICPVGIPNMRPCPVGIPTVNYAVGPFPSCIYALQAFPTHDCMACVCPYAPWAFLTCDNALWAPPFLRPVGIPNIFTYPEATQNCPVGTQIISICPVGIPTLPHMPCGHSQHAPVPRGHPNMWTMPRGHSQPVFMPRGLPQHPLSFPVNIYPVAICPLAFQKICIFPVGICIDLIHSCPTGPADLPDEKIYSYYSYLFLIFYNTRSHGMPAHNFGLWPSLLYPHCSGHGWPQLPFTPTLP